MHTDQWPERTRTAQKSRQETYAVAGRRWKAKMKVDTIMTKDVAFCKGNTRLDEVARLMAAYNCSALPVLEDEKSRKVVGILTERDIVRRTLAVGKNPAGLTASACMTSDVYVAKSDSEIDDCLKTMEQHHIRRLPIIDDKRACCGIVTLTNLAEFLPAPTVGEALKEITEPERKHNGGAHKPAGNSFGERLPYLTFGILPEDVKKQLPKRAQEVYIEAFNSALDEMEASPKRPDSPETAHRSATKVAWAAVRQKFQKDGDQWIAKSASVRD